LMVAMPFHDLALPRKSAGSPVPPFGLARARPTL